MACVMLIWSLVPEADAVAFFCLVHGLRLESLLCRMASGVMIPLPWTLPQSCTVSGCWASMQ